MVNRLKSEPEACLHQLLPGLDKVAGQFKITGKHRFRPIDLYLWHPEHLDGIVAIGDAWSSSCPGTGTGTSKAINDALQLCGTHIPKWLETNRMGRSKISAFYQDPEKQKIDSQSRNQAFKLRSLTLDHSPYWSFQRWGRFLYHGVMGKLEAVTQKPIG